MKNYSLNKNGEKINNKFSYKYKIFSKKLLLLILLFISYYNENIINTDLIKIAYYCISFQNSGVERVMSLLINYLSREKKFNHYLITIKVKSRGEYLINENVKRISLLQENISLIEAINLNHIDILIYNFYRRPEINELNKLKQTKIIYYDHSSYFFWLYRNIYKFEESVYYEYKRCKYVISLIPLENDYLFKKWGINSILMENPLTFEYELVIPSDLTKKNVIMIGRANDILKRFELGIKAMEYIIKEIPECEMNIISFPEKKYEILIKHLNLEKKVRFVGYQEKVEIFLKNSSLHILPSISEAYPMVLSETKIFGIPSIIIGLDYLTLAKKGTVIIYDDDPYAIAKEAIKIFKNDKYRKILGKEARKSMKNQKNSILAKRWKKLLISVYKGRRPSFSNKLNTQRTLSKIEAEKILNNQLMLIHKRMPILSKLSFDKLINFSLT